MAMRLGDTPVPIPNTMVKTQTADGTALETVWESRWPPDYERKDELRLGSSGKRGGTTEKRNRCEKSLIINTGKDEQQLINANPVSRAVLL